MHILATFATLCCQTRWPRNHSCTTQEHVSFFRTFSGTRQKPTGQNRTFSEISTFSRFCQKPSKTEKTCAHMSEKHKIYVRHVRKKNFTNKTFCKCSQKHFRTNKISANVQMCTNVQICKCAKNRRAQNAQICSANIFPNAEITNLHCAQFCQMQISAHVTIFLCAQYFL